MRKVDNLNTFMCQIVLKSGSLNLLEPSRPVQACNGIDLPFQLLVSLSSSSSCVRLLPLLRITSTLSTISPSIRCFKTVATPDVTNPVSLPSVNCMYHIPVHFNPMHYVFVAHTIGPTVLHLSPAPRFKNYDGFLI